MRERALIAHVGGSPARGSLRPHAEHGVEEIALQRYLPLVRQVARRLIGRVAAPADLDDLVAWGTLGLLDALGKYEPARAAPLSSYARSGSAEPSSIICVRSTGYPAACARNGRRGAHSAHARDHARPACPGRRTSWRAARLLARRLSRSAHADRARALVSLEDLGFGDGEAEAASRARGLRPAAEPAAAGASWPGRAGGRAAAGARAAPALVVHRDELTMKPVGSLLRLAESRMSRLHAQALPGCGRAWAPPAAPDRRGRFRSEGCRAWEPVRDRTRHEVGGALEQVYL